MKNLLFFLFFCLPASVSAQEVETLFGEGMDHRFIWSFDWRTMSIQRSIGSSIGVSGGLVYSETFVVGGFISANLTHPKINTAAAALFVRYVHDPQKLFHPVAALIFGSGTVKDYEKTKTNPFDNFGNVFGAGYFFAEPEVGFELNTSKKTKLAVCIGYRIATGAEPDHPSVILYRPTNGDVSGMQVSLRLQFE